jgi:hypothetical protein
MEGQSESPYTHQYSSNTPAFARTLTRLWKSVIDFGRRTGDNHHEELWEGMKTIFDKHDEEFLVSDSITQLITRHYYHKLYKSDSPSISIYNHLYGPEIHAHNHLFQQFHIPAQTGRLSLTGLMKIAFHIGLFLHSAENGGFNQGPEYSGAHSEYEESETTRLLAFHKRYLLGKLTTFVRAAFP